jgi:hypothetical protein
VGDDADEEDRRGITRSREYSRADMSNKAK